MVGILVSLFFCLLWVIFTICAVVRHFASEPDKKFQQDTYMLDDIRGNLIVKVEGEEPLTIPFYKMGQLPIDHNVFISIMENGYGRLSISDICVNGHWMFDYCPKGIAWESRAAYCILQMKKQGMASGQISTQAIERIEEVHRNIYQLNGLLEEGRLTVKHDNGEPYYFYYV